MSGVDVHRRFPPVGVTFAIRQGSEETVTVRYRAAQFDPTGWSKAPDPIRATHEGLARTIAAWNVTGDGGAPYPITADSLAELSDEFLRQTFRAIAWDLLMRMRAAGEALDRESGV